MNELNTHWTNNRQSIFMDKMPTLQAIYSNENSLNLQGIIFKQSLLWPPGERLDLMTKFMIDEE